MSNKKDVRVYGNQYGTWVELSGNLLLKICVVLNIDVTNMSLDDHDAIERFVTEAIERKAAEVLNERPSMVGP